MNKKNIFMILTTVFFFTFFLATPALAGADPRSVAGALDTFAEPTGVEQTTLTEQVGSTMVIVYQITGTLFLILAIYGGIRWMTASGNEEVVGKARNIVIGATVGLALIVSAYGITSYLTSRAADAFGGGGSDITEEGTPNGDGEIEKFDQGCCINKTRGADTFFGGHGETGQYYVIYNTTETFCERNQAENGRGQERGIDWEWYTGVQIPAECDARLEDFR